MTPVTLVDLLCRGAAHRPALSDPDGISLDYVDLCNAADAIGAALATHGVQPGDRVAAVLPDGAAYLAAFAGTAAARAAFAPLAAPDGLARLRPRLVLAPPEVPQGIRVAANALGIPVVTVAIDAAGLALVDGEHVYDAHGRTAGPDDPAFITADGIPVAQGALVAAALESARPASGTVRLAVPLSELRGLVGAIAVLAAGGHLVVAARAAAAA
ncbi:MAG: AMP-binding enzyme [Candidatus Eremiobacteraeota bacterium]|nr:AMP-binding enzyme [Candidatus Eremiobacteraeota bacterium]